MSKKRALIVTGGTAGPWALQYINPDDLLIGADHGAAFLIANGFKPDIALGDFDSVTDEEWEAIKAYSKEVRDCDPIDKNYTDTELALRAALDSGARSIAIIGAIGSRLDHTLANIQLLKVAHDHGARAAIIDEHNHLQLMTSELSISKNPSYRYVSLLPLSASVTGITLEGFKYPLHEATLETGQSLCISNELADTANTSHIRMRSGLLLVIQSSD
ncbi:thiamine diphosphokinase [Paenibacillus sp. GCM10027626]|uniref:thiamine diphosphokinase n=1 Tax=Paenibacillus sp. GCM10027626 TaxID=3273411 RepID=UPI00362FBB91